MTRRHSLATGLLVAMLGVTGLSACDASGSISVGAGSGASEGATARASSLWANRTDFVGDNSKIIALVRDAGIAAPGTYTISLGTSTRPYAVTVHLDKPAKPAGTTDFTSPATILLGAVGNLDEVRVVGGSRDFSLTSGQASTALGYDVKLLGRDESRLRHYVEGLAD
ncbi:MAG: DUF4825 domain-containing protein [Humibacillus sp.]